MARRLGARGRLRDGAGPSGSGARRDRRAPAPPPGVSCCRAPPDARTAPLAGPPPPAPARGARWRHAPPSRGAGLGRRRRRHQLQLARGAGSAAPPFPPLAFATATFRAAITRNLAISPAVAPLARRQGPREKAAGARAPRRPPGLTRPARGYLKTMPWSEAAQPRGMSPRARARRGPELLQDRHADGLPHRRARHRRPDVRRHRAGCCSSAASGSSSTSSPTGSPTRSPWPPTAPSRSRGSSCPRSTTSWSGSPARPACPCRGSTSSPPPPPTPSPPAGTRPHAAVAVTEGILRILNPAAAGGRAGPRAVARAATATSSSPPSPPRWPASSPRSATSSSGARCWAASAGSSDDDRGGDVFGALAWAILAPIVALMIQLAVSRSREYGADATGAALVGDPEPLAEALLTLERGNEAIPYQYGGPATAHLFIVSPLLRRRAPLHEPVLDPPAHRGAGPPAPRAPTGRPVRVAPPAPPGQGPPLPRPRPEWRHAGKPDASSTRTRRRASGGPAASPRRSTRSAR